MSEKYCTQMSCTTVSGLSVSPEGVGGVEVLVFSSVGTGCGGMFAS